MPAHKSTRTEFPLPDDWEPDGITCVMIPCPDDPQYIAQLVGLIDLLKMSKSFARDATATGAATVSRTWQAALESMPILMGACMSGVVLRLTEDCKLEVQDCDDPDVWRPVVTGQIDGEGGYDPRYDDSPAIPYPDAPPDGACIAAANATEAIKATADKISEAMDTSGPMALLLSGLMFIFQILITAVIDIINMGALLNVVSELDPDTVRADYTAFDWQDLTDIISCYYEDDGTMTHANHVALINAIAVIIPGASSQMYTIAHWFLIQSGPKGMQRAATYAAITEAECDGNCDDIVIHVNYAGMVPADLRWMTAVDGSIHQFPDLNITEVSNPNAQVPEVHLNGFKVSNSRRFYGEVPIPSGYRVTKIDYKLNGISDAPYYTLGLMTEPNVQHDARDEVVEGGIHTRSWSPGYSGATDYVRVYLVPSNWNAGSFSVAIYDIVIYAEPV